MTCQTSNAISILNNILFGEVDDKVFLKSIENNLEKKVLKASTVIFSQGDDIDGLYLVVSGQVEVYTKRDNKHYTLSHAEENHLVGEFLLQGRGVRSVSTQTSKDSILYFLPSVTLIRLFKKFPEQGSLLSIKIANRLFWNQTILALHMCYLFEGLSEKIIRQLVNEMEILSVSANTILIRQYDISDDLYIIIDGQFQIYRTVNLVDEDLNIVGRGESIGEIGVICQTPRLANALAIRDSTIAKLNRESYEKILKAYPIEINQSFVKSAINHLSIIKKNKFKAAESFTLVGLPSVDTSKTTQQLVTALSDFGLTTFITSTNVDIAFNQDGVAQSTFDSEINHSLLQWISEQEIAHRYVIYVIDDSMTQWTQRCLRQADHILFLANAEENPEIMPLERLILNELENKRAKKTLLLSYSNLTTPENTVDWLNGRTCNKYHHITENKKADYKRVARFLTGNTIGVVFGGGGARGFAHIGVIRAFKALNIPIDLVGGNSMGAVVAAEYAMQWTQTEMIDKTQQLCLGGDRFTLPIRSLFSGKKMTEGLQSMFGDRGIEDLWLQFFSVSCNISRATVMTHDKGSLLAAILNSNTPPGLFPPQVVDGDLLVDGALLNNVPVDVMEGINPGATIIAIDVNAKQDLLNNTDNYGGISGWRLLLDKINPLVDNDNSPNLIEILSRASIIGGLAQRKKGMDGIAELYLQPPVNEFSLTAYKQAEEIEEIGYQYALKELQRWLNES